MSASRPSPTAVVVSHAPGDHLEPCLASLAREGLRAVVVDNGSAGERVARIAAGHEGFAVVPLHENAGFAAAANRGTEAARHWSSPEWLLLLNDDATLEGGFVDALATAPLDATRFAMVAALRLEHARPETIDSAGLELGSDGGVRDWLGGMSVHAAPLEPVEVLGPSAGAALYSSEMLAGVGGFEESYFAYFEDVDLALRARAAGHRAMLVPSARALHRGGVTARARAYRRLVWLERNRVRTVVRQFPRALVAPTLARAIASALARGAQAATTGTRVGAEEAARSALSPAVAATAHLEAWLRAGLRSPGDLIHRGRRGAVIEEHELRRWLTQRSRTLTDRRGTGTPDDVRAGPDDVGAGPVPARATHDAQTGQDRARHSLATTYRFGGS